MILIRADANEKIGIGHVMRCLSIARAFASSGQDVSFVTADNRGERLISSAGFHTICMDSNWTEMDQEPIESILDEYNPSLLIIDSYYVTSNYLSMLSSFTCTAYIDDMNEDTWDVDYITNYNIYGPVLDYASYKSSRSKVLLGPAYTPLRPEFQNAPPHSVKEVTDIMISAGGADPQGVTEILMNGLCPQWPDIKFHFLVGALNPRLEYIRDITPGNAILHINEKDVSGLMKMCDVAISASGSTLYELCACGTPTITYTLADNQLLAAAEFQKQGLMVSAGDYRNNIRFTDTVLDKLKNLIEDQDRRKQLSRNMQRVVDGKGAERLVQTMNPQIG